MITRFAATIFVVLFSSSLFACAGLDYCSMPAKKKLSSWTFFQSFQQVNYDHNGTKSYFQWTPHLEFDISETWRVGGQVPFVSFSNGGESGFGNVVLFTDFEIVSEKNNRWLMGIQSEMVTGRTDNGIAVSSPQLLPYITWLPTVGDFQLVTNLGYLYRFGSLGDSSDEGSVASLTHDGESHAKPDAAGYTVNLPSQQALLGRVGGHFPVFSQVTMGVYADTVYVLDADVGSRFLATLEMNLSTKLWGLDMALGGSVPVTDEKRNFGSLYASMRVGF